MNRDDIIRMAREACPYTTDEMRGAFYEGFIKGAVAERESCAQLCEIQDPYVYSERTANACAAAIPQRGNQ